MKSSCIKNTVCVITASLALVSQAYAYNKKATDALHISVAANDIPGALEALRQGADPNSWEGYDNLPLHDAIRLDNPLMVQILLCANADPNKENPNTKQAALGYTVTCYQLRNHSEIVDLLLRNGAKTEQEDGLEKESIIAIAEEKSLVELVALLLEHGAQRHSYDPTWWHNDTLTGEQTVIQFLIKLTETHLQEEYTALENHRPLINTLTKKYSGWFNMALSRLRRACEKRILKTNSSSLQTDAQMLLKGDEPQPHKPRQKIKEREKISVSFYDDGATNNLCALLAGTDKPVNPEDVQELLEHDFANPSGYNLEGKPALHLAINLTNVPSQTQCSIIKLLLEHEANPDICDAMGKPALHEAMDAAPPKTQCSIVKLLLEHGANPDICDANGIPALHKALELSQGGVEIMTDLLNHGADPTCFDRKGVDAIQKAEKENLPDAANLLRAHSASPFRARSASPFNVESLRAALPEN
jgi:ankyrin repeat protein